jgi:hypothetical protein
MAAIGSLLLRDDRAIASWTFMEVLLLSFESGVPVFEKHNVATPDFFLFQFTLLMKLTKKAEGIEQFLGEIGELKR